MTASKSEIWHGTKFNLKIGEKKMKKYRLYVKSEKDLKALNEKIAIDSLFSVGETITNNPLHIGENIFSDKRIFDSVKEYAFTHNFVSLTLYQTIEEKFAVLKSGYEQTFGNFAFIPAGCGYENNTLISYTLEFSGYSFVRTNVVKLSLFYLRNLLNEYTYYGGAWRDKKSMKTILYNEL